jgi:hypothetical protein
MEQRLLGGSGVKVPVLSYGSGTFNYGTTGFTAWGSSGVEEARRLIDICLEAGLNFFDSADVYSDIRRGRQDQQVAAADQLLKVVAVGAGWGVEDHPVLAGDGLEALLAGDDGKGEVAPIGPRDGRVVRVAVHE